MAEVKEASSEDPAGMQGGHRGVERRSSRVGCRDARRADEAGKTTDGGSSPCRIGQAMPWATGGTAGVRKDVTGRGTGGLVAERTPVLIGGALVSTGGTSATPRGWAAGAGV